MILDEPGNHLDVETVEALATALENYKGTVIFTSHDRHFVRRVATRVIEVHDGRVKQYFGNYDDYLVSVESEIDEGERQRTGKSAGGGGKQPLRKTGQTTDKRNVINARQKRKSKTLKGRSRGSMTNARHSNPRC